MKFLLKKNNKGYFLKSDRSWVKETAIKKMREINKLLAEKEKSE